MHTKQVSCTQNRSHDALLQAVTETCVVWHFGTQAATFPAHDLVFRLCTHLEHQEQALLWALRSLAALQTGPQLEASVVGLVSSAERAQLEQLPVLMTSMGECLKRGGDRDKMMWVYAALKNIPVRGAAGGRVAGGQGRNVCV